MNAIMNLIKSAKAAIATNDPALVSWARRNLECEMEGMGDSLRKFRRRAISSRFPVTQQDAIAWEAEYRQSYLASMADMAALLGEIDVLEF